MILFKLIIITNDNENCMEVDMITQITVTIKQCHADFSTGDMIVVWTMLC